MTRSARKPAPPDAFDRDKPGRTLAERWGIKIIGVEGHDLKCACVACDSSDAGRINAHNGVYFCYSCSTAVNAFDLCKVVLGDHKAAIQMMVDVGLFHDDYSHDNGNGKVGGQAGILKAIARAKGVSAEAFVAYGAKVKGQAVVLPVFGPDGQRCSSFTLTLNNGKGLYEEAKPVGLFLLGRKPQPGEQWCIVEGVKDAAALQQLGFLAAGLPNNRMTEKLAPMFTGTESTVIPDADKTGTEGAISTAKVLWPFAKQVRVARLPVEHRQSHADDVRDVLKRLAERGPELIRQAVREAKLAGEDGKPIVLVDYGLITAAELLKREYRIEYLVPGVLAKGQHMLLGGPPKVLKSLIATDLAVSLARAGHFLGYSPSAAPCV